MTTSWSPNQDWAGYGWHPGRCKGIAAGVNARAGHPPWRPSKRKGPDRRRIGYRVLHGNGLAAQCVASLQMLLAVPASVRKITNARSAPGLSERAQEGRCSSAEKSHAAKAWSAENLPQEWRKRAAKRPWISSVKGALRSGLQGIETGRRCSVKGGRPLMSN